MIDATLRGPLLGTFFMAISASMIGVLAFVRRRSLIGEALSHAAYPGVVCGAAIADVCIVPGAFLTALLGIGAVRWLEKRTTSDAALCVILSSFLGIGVTIASVLQVLDPMAYRRSLTYLYGQAATMTDNHMILYASFALVMTLYVTINYRYLQLSHFDRPFAKVLGIKLKGIEAIQIILLALAIVMGIRSVGVVLMAGMLVAPAIAAREWTNKLSHMLILAPLFGGLSALLGAYFATNLPTGPVILLIAAALAFLSMFKSALLRFLRKVRFRWQCHLENGLKLVWKYGPADLGRITSHRLVQCGYLTRRGGPLTVDGMRKAQQIVRLHRLWEVYLSTCLGASSEKVHRSAEEMEHILTPELEIKLLELMGNPTLDPHQQPIPERVR